MQQGASEVSPPCLYYYNIEDCVLFGKKHCQNTVATHIGLQMLAMFNIQHLLIVCHQICVDFAENALFTGFGIICWF